MNFKLFRTKKQRTQQPIEKPQVQETQIHVQSFQWRYAVITTDEGLQGFINSEGFIICNPIYDWIDISHLFDYSIAIVRKSGKYGLVDENGKQILDTIYDEISLIYGELSNNTYIAEVQIKGLKALFFINLKTLTKLAYNDFKIDKENQLIYTFKDNKQGIINLKTGREIISPKYEEIIPWGYFYKVKNNSKWGLVNIYSEEVLQPIYDEIEPFRHHFARIMKDGLYGFINEKGTLLADARYSLAGDFFGNGTMVCYPDKKQVFWLTEDGEERELNMNPRYKQ